MTSFEKGLLGMTGTSRNAMKWLEMTTDGWDD